MVLARDLPSKMPSRPGKPGDRLPCIGPCGGRYVATIRRPPEAVRQDVLDGLLNAEADDAIFGVTLHTASDVDATVATQRTTQGFDAGN